MGNNRSRTRKIQEPCKTERQAHSGHLLLNKALSIRQASRINNFLDVTASLAKRKTAAVRRPTRPFRARAHRTRLRICLISNNRRDRVEDSMADTHMAILITQARTIRRT